MEIHSEIPFEIHITTEPLTSSKELDFVNFCKTIDAKPILIELAKGDVIHQPMFSKIIYSANVDEVLSISKNLSRLLHNNNFIVKRLKIEVPSENFNTFKIPLSSFCSYFEWHCKINCTQTDELLDICKNNKAHLSKNNLKTNHNARFITLRDFETQFIFETRKEKIINELKQGNWIILKQESEYCIYDNNNLLDNGWLTQ